MQTGSEITRLIEAVHDGDADAFDRMVALVYPELRRIAHRQMRGQGGALTLGTTALVHESYLKLAARGAGDWQDRAHFFAAAARAMRHILIDHARRNATAKRGGGQRRVAFLEAERGIEVQADLLLALDDALTRLEQRDARQHRVVECRFFGGMSEAETAAALGVTTRTVRRDWLKARTWLYAALYDDPVDAANAPVAGERYARGNA